MTHSRKIELECVFGVCGSDWKSTGTIRSPSGETIQTVKKEFILQNKELSFANIESIKRYNFFLIIYFWNKVIELCGFCRIT